MSCQIQKLLDDTAQVGLLTRGNDFGYKREIETFVGCCDANFLKLNVRKTKELIIDFRRKKEEVLPVIIKG